MVNSDLIKGAFGSRPHDFYVAYDELSDEFIVRLIDPKKLTYLEELDNGNEFIGLIVESDSDEIVGFELFNFEKHHLKQPSWSNLNRNWNVVKDTQRKIGYMKYHYDPKINRATKRDLPVTSQEFYNQNARILERELVSSLA
jgi:hypothetical protein